MQFNLTPVVRNLLLINIAVFVVQSLGAPLIELFGLRPVVSDHFAAYQIITNIFIHGDFRHLMSNMLGLFFLGPMLESFWGSQRFMIFYFVTAIGASIFYAGVNLYEINQLRESTESYIQHPTPSKFVPYLKENANTLYRANYDFVNAFQEHPTDPTYIRESVSTAKLIYSQHSNGIMFGASGAVFGLLMAMGLLFPNTELFLLFIPFPVKVKYMVGAFTLFELYAGLVKPEEGDNVAHFTHLGGALFAYLIIKFWNSKSEHFY